MTRKRFRETLWFKKGFADAAAAGDDAADLGDDGDAMAPRNELLPVEDRYLEDGSLRPSDSMLFGLHTGTTQAIDPVDIVRTMNSDPAGVASAAISERTLIAELKHGRRVVLAMLALAMLALGGVAMTAV